MADSGLPEERTDLAWGRTLLSMIALSSLLLRWLPSHGIATLLPLGLSIGGAVAIALLRRNRRAEVLGAGTPEGGTAAEEVIGLTVLILTVGVASVILILQGY